METKINGKQQRHKGSNDWRVKVGLAEMLKGGVIMDVTNAEQARIAEKAGAVRGHGARARARGHPQRRRRGAHGLIKMIREIMKTRHHSGDGQGPHRPFCGGAGARGARSRLTSMRAKC